MSERLGRQLAAWEIGNSAAQQELADDFYDLNDRQVGETDDTDEMVVTSSGFFVNQGDRHEV